MTSEVVVVSVGARTPVGVSAAPAAAAVRAQISRLVEHATFEDAAGNSLKCAPDPHLPPTMPAVRRIGAMARHAILDAIRPLTWARPLGLPVTVLVAFPEVRPGFAAADVGRIMDDIGEMFTDDADDVQCRGFALGHAGFIQAAQIARAQVVSDSGLCLICGADSYLDRYTLDWLDSERRLARDEIRDGFIPGEAAGVMAITTEAVRSARKFPRLGVLRSVALAQEPRLRTSPEGCLGEGLTRATRQACSALGDTLVDDIYSDINGERHRVDELGFMLLRSPECFRDGTRYKCPSDAWGDVGAASAALGGVLAVESWRRGRSDGQHALVLGSSDGGLRGALLLADGGR